MMKVVAIIPARGGSKGIPGKNMIDFCGKPLIAWTILQAMDATSVDDVFVSSESEEVLAIAKRYGALPIRRPQELAGDESPSEAALEHALDEIREMSGQEDPELVVFLQATSPLRESSDIDGAVAALREASADSVFSAAVLDDICVWERDGDQWRGLTYDPEHRGRRQGRLPLYLENGSIYVFRPEILRRDSNRIGGKIAHYEMPFWKSYEINTLSDVEVCEYYFRGKLLSATSSAGHAAFDMGAVDLVVYDFDGVMTDNRVLVSQDGAEAVFVNRADGWGVGLIRGLGILQLILSTETNPVVRARAEKLGVDVIHGSEDKKRVLEAYCAEKGVDMGRVLFVGNDVNDLGAMSAVGCPVAPADAHPDILDVALIVTASPGGAGVVRELAERYLVPARTGGELP